MSDRGWGKIPKCNICSHLDSNCFRLSICPECWGRIRLLLMGTQEIKNSDIPSRLPPHVLGGMELLYKILKKKLRK